MKCTDDAQEQVQRGAVHRHLKEHQLGPAVAEICRRHGISDATFYTWRSKYGGLEVSDASEGFRGGDRRLKKLMAEQMLDAATLREMLAKTSDTNACSGSTARSG